MSLIANWIRNRRWRSLAKLIELELNTIPSFARTKIFATTLLLRDSHLSNDFLSQVALHPQNYSIDVAADLAYFFEDEAIAIQNIAALQSLEIFDYSNGSQLAEKYYLFVRSCQIWTTTFSTAFIPKNVMVVQRIWDLLSAERNGVIKAMLYLDGELQFPNGLNGIHKDQFSTQSIESFHFDARRLPQFNHRQTTNFR